MLILYQPVLEDKENVAVIHSSISDPDDPHQMDFVGFDATAPTLLAGLARL